MPDKFDDLLKKGNYTAEDRAAFKGLEAKDADKPPTPPPRQGEARPEAKPPQLDQDTKARIEGVEKNGKAAYDQLQTKSASPNMIDRFKAQSDANRQKSGELAKEAGNQEVGKSSKPNHIEAAQKEAQQPPKESEPKSKGKAQDRDQER